MSDDYDPALTPSRAAWRDRADFRSYLNREAEARERREQARQEYRDTLREDCAHGPRVRTVQHSGGRPWGALACPMAVASCGLKLLSDEQVFLEWKNGQPDGNPAGA